MKVYIWSLWHYTCDTEGKSFSGVSDKTGKVFAPSLFIARLLASFVSGVWIGKWASPTHDETKFNSDVHIKYGFRNRRLQLRECDVVSAGGWDEIFKRLVNYPNREIKGD